MLFFIFVLILAVGIVGCVIEEKSQAYSFRLNLFIATCVSVGIMSVSISLLVLIANLLPAPGQFDSLVERRASLVYQLENDLYDNDNDIGKKELMSEIQAFNERTVFYKSMQRNFWLGIYIPNIYDDIELIRMG